MENLKALVYEVDLTTYQRALARREFKDMVERLELLEKAVKNNAGLPHVSNLFCGSFEPDNKTSSATRCKCGREKREHPKAT